jgi:hypothetical protein
VSTRPAVRPRSRAAVLGSPSLPWELGWVDIALTSSHMMRPAPREPGRKEVAHSHPVVAGEVQVRGELNLAPTGPSLERKVEHLQQQQRPNQPLRRNRGSTRLGVALLELSIQLHQCLGDHRTARPQRMFRRHPRLGRNIAEHSFLLRVRLTHRGTSAVRQTAANFSEIPGFFSSLLMSVQSTIRSRTS